MFYEIPERRKRNVEVLQPNNDNKEKLKAMLVSFIATFITGLGIKLIMLLFATPQVDTAIGQLAEAQSFWVQLFGGSGAAAAVTHYFAGGHK